MYTYTYSDNSTVVRSAHSITPSAEYKSIVGVGDRQTERQTDKGQRRRLKTLSTVWTEA